ncbi:MAG: 23S rRNA (uracil(1939)-C(5))-methyltransferase RlmD [Rouxiella badensis]|jgi:23S rRNA (uracil1939-C5)-methyltransferase|uniref:23S rRNA (uracil(1939)-C(5))-methyltransferase RlmD n=1 Tax=Rouxiella badensis TaxID=1646377 RepID=A0A1X0WKM2_9GAMM|nr:23S rRNA (uracil(1939)-C(5))-methyltransferase RlmD [Rouxiella badensis]ORJ27309.1 23S rRNA (uracil(1939)-C(5))-methyltransferase [Rouxiella badensis]QII40686.1 23S rRNA (uracil(1939)-C(5))-methyltransferase RlmD [Rouxiella badensis]QOI57783.1 23S rRNA (uracil(1939)-C(5))-methyltransferase RlmD [Rouxiella badensis subsp. acadiensis]WAT05096.1 23S rRNA (uracil(1939)-C(5))-methyltransferase RlmD [Rouxiella badensis]
MAQFYSPNRRVTTRQMITVTATDLDAFGQGVARHKGKTIFVTGLLPGEQAEVTLTEDKRQYAKGRVKRLLSTSEDRVAPECPHFSVCGGCQQQHASVALQQRSKSESLLRLIARETGVNAEPAPVIAAEPYGYRRRAKLGLQIALAKPGAKKMPVMGKPQKGAAVASGPLMMGFRQEGSNSLINITRCPVLRPELEQLLVPLHQCLAALKAVSRLGHVELVLADNGPVVVLRHLDPLVESDRENLLAFAERHGITFFLAPDSENIEKLCGESPFYHIDGLALQFNPRDFIQVNDAVNQKMVAQALSWLDIQPEDRVLDLFCGMGNFTLPLAKRAKQVVGVEGVATLVANGQDNAKRNHLSHVSFYHENLEDDVSRQPWAAQGFNKVLLDPARAGAPGVMAHIIKLAPQRVVYVSCNPTTLARDSKTLLEAGYRLKEVRMLDMFPHTGHLESMALFINQSGE